MKLLFLIPLVGALSLQGGAGGGAVHVWKSSELKGKGQALARKLDANKVATETLAPGSKPGFVLAYREASGQAELHDTEGDVMFFVEGEVTMVHGGTVVDGKTTAPGETRGSGITGGTEVRLGPGDVLHIPAKVAHQMKLAPGARVTYFVAKVAE
jgi:mannose-6-phosphate isomerase-like protein (cupin superfamily)